MLLYTACSFPTEYNSRSEHFILWEGLYNTTVSNSTGSTVLDPGDDYLYKESKICCEEECPPNTVVPNWESANGTPTKKTRVCTLAKNYKNRMCPIYPTSVLITTLPNQPSVTIQNNQPQQRSTLRGKHYGRSDQIHLELPVGSLYVHTTEIYIVRPQLTSSCK